MAALSETETVITPARPDRATVADAEPVLARQIVQEVARRGHSPAALCRGLGFDVTDLDSPDFRISYTQTSQIVQRALRTLDDRQLGLELGAGFNLVSWGFCLIGLMAAPDSRAMLELALEFLPATGRFLEAQGAADDRGYTITATPVFDEPEVNAVLVENTFASLVRVGRHVAGDDYGPLAVAFALEAPDDTAAYESFFGCPVEFGAPAHRLSFPADPVKIPTSDARVARMSRHALALQRAGARAASELEEVIVRALRHNLRQPPSMQSIAASINLSERTLRRRLVEAGLSYASLLDSERMRRALSVLREDNLTLPQVADAAGFADVRSLRRAVKRWTGRTPSQVRQTVDENLAPGALSAASLAADDDDERDDDLELGGEGVEDPGREAASRGPGPSPATGRGDDRRTSTAAVGADDDEDEDDVR